MELIWDSWPTWFVGVFLGIALFKFLGNHRTAEVHPGMATSSEDFSMKSTFLHFRGGEAALFFTSLLTMGSFLLFSLSVARIFMDLFPS